MWMYVIGTSASNGNAPTRGGFLHIKIYYLFELVFMSNGVIMPVDTSPTYTFKYKSYYWSVLM